MQLKSPIVILGGGHMGGALARQWYESRIGTIRVVERDAVRLSALNAAGIRGYAAIEETPIEQSIIVLAIKPQQLAAIGDAVRERIKNSRMLISIMAGVPLAELQKLSPHAARVMPNLPAQISRSMSVACAPELDATRREALSHMFEHVGAIEWVEDENLLHAVTAISGSGPAYLFAFMEALEAAAIEQGLDAALARKLVMETMRGSALLATLSDTSFSSLRQQVASPGGTTEAAISAFGQGGLDKLVKAAVGAALNRSKELAK